MTAQIAQLHELEETYKVREAEGLLDLYFYRKVGFRLAQFFARLGMSPVSVTLLGGVIGLIAGHLYYYRDLRFTFAGFALHILANAFDNADGQLARMTGKASREGRIIDSLVDHIVFGNIYLHLTLRCLAGGSSPAIWILAAAAALSHAVQGGAADYFRNGFLYFGYGRGRAQLDSSAHLQPEYRGLDWGREPWKKLMLGLCLNFTRQQEMLVPVVIRLRAAVDRQYPDEIPERLRAPYREWAVPMFKWCGLLMANTRMILLFFLLLMDQPAWFFWIELTVFNLLVVWLVVEQTKMSRSLLEMVLTPSGPGQNV